MARGEGNVVTRYKCGIEQSFADPEAVTSKLLGEEISWHDRTTATSMTKLDFSTVWFMSDPWFIELVLGNKKYDATHITYSTLNTNAVTFLMEVWSDANIEKLRGCVITSLIMRSKLNTALLCTANGTCGKCEQVDSSVIYEAPERWSEYIFKVGTVEDAAGKTISEVSGFLARINTGQKLHGTMGTADAVAATAGRLRYEGILMVADFGSMLMKIVNERDANITLRLKFVRDEAGVVEFIFTNIVCGTQGQRVTFKAAKLTINVSK